MKSKAKKSSKYAVTSSPSKTKASNTKASKSKTESTNSLPTTSGAKKEQPSMMIYEDGMLIFYLKGGDRKRVNKVLQERVSRKAIKSAVVLPAIMGLKKVKEKWVMNFSNNLEYPVPPQEDIEDEDMKKENKDKDVIVIYDTDDEKLL